MQLKPSATPCFAMKEQVERELNRLVKQGIVKKVDYSDLAAPVPKSDGAVRTLYLSATINPSLQVVQYPLPRPNDLFTCLTGGKVFT